MPPILRLFTGAPNTRTLLLALLVVDAVFLAGHLSLELLGAEGYFDPAIEQASGEGLQYVKWIWCILMCWQLASLLPYTRLWTMILGYLFFDDALGLHERAGLHLAEWLALDHLNGFRAMEVGEFLYMAALGSVLAAGFIFSVLRCPPAQRGLFYPFLALVCALLAFGGLGDAVHAALWKWRLEEVLELVEEVGEMVSLTLLTAYLFDLWAPIRMPGPSQSAPS